MNSFAKTFAGITLLCSTYGFAVPCHEDKEAACGRVCRDEQMSMPDGVPLPAYNRDCPIYYVAAAYTYWTAREDGLEITEGNFENTTAATLPIIPMGKVTFPEFVARSGFKVAIGATFEHDDWDSVLQYTWFNNNARLKNVSGINPGYANSVLDDDQINSVLAQWKNNFNRIDWQLARSFYAGHYLTLRSFLGLIGAWDNQHFNAEYTLSGSPAYYNSYNKQSWWSVGPYAGLDNNFLLYVTNCNQFSLFCDAGLALGWGTFSTTQSAYFISSIFNSTALAEKSFSTVSPMMELALGLRWESWWKDNAYMFLLQAGWELQVWFSHNQMVPITPTPGNLSLQGLTLKALFAF